MYKLEDTKKAALIFEGINETMVYSCLDKSMGCVYADQVENPNTAMAMLGDFCFLAGKPDRRAVRFKPADCKRDFMIMIPENEEWSAIIEEIYGERARKVTRYATKKEEHVWDQRNLEMIVKRLPEEFEMKLLDEYIFDFAKNHQWAADWISQFEDYEAYQKNGLGMVILKDGIPVSGASSYSCYAGGIEIEIDTREDFWRRGLAAACGAGLILECEKRGIYPAWDAQNPWSLALAKKLGYHFSHEYTAFEICGY